MADDTKDEKAGSDHICLRVTGQDGSSVTFKIKKHASLKKLMNAYCNRAGLTMDTVRFRYDGLAINPEDTPAELSMEDEDNIDVFQPQTGGCLSIPRELHVQ